MCPPVGFFDRLIPRKRREERQAKEARSRELEGDLAGAVERYLEAGLPDDAARVLLLRADAEVDFDRRIAFCLSAARTASDEALRAKAARRKARISFDVLRARGAAVPSELGAVARELEAAGEFEAAAEAFALAGDPDGEVRALTSAGAIDRLEERLRRNQADARGQRELEFVARRIADLDRTAERREALVLAARHLEGSGGEAIAEAARRIRARLVRDAVVAIEIDGEAQRVAFGGEITIGRGDATIVVASSSVSRKHVRLLRGPEGLLVEDLGTRNGTFLDGVGGARLGGPVPVGRGIALRLGGEVPCAIRPADGVRACDSEGSLCWIEVAGERYLAPLGPLRVLGWALDRIEVGLEAGGRTEREVFLQLICEGAAGAPFLGEYELARRVELCFGDALAIERRGRPRLRIAPPGRTGSLAV